MHIIRFMSLSASDTPIAGCRVAEWMGSTEGRAKRKKRRATTVLFTVRLFLAMQHERAARYRWSSEMRKVFVSCRSAPPPLSTHTQKGVYPLPLSTTSSSRLFFLLLWLNLCLCFFLLLSTLGLLEARQLSALLCGLCEV
jgi:hypothetical protein